MENNTHNDYYEVKEEEIFNKPIDYMSLEVDDFPGFEVKKDLIDIPDGKFLTETIIDKHIQPRVSDTTVINSSVGQGKSHLAIEIALRYINLDDYKGKYAVIFVAPHKSLVSQYKYKLSRAIFHKIPNYEKLIEEPFDPENPGRPNINNINYNKKVPLHVITVDCLLGKAGEAPQQSYIKRKYIDNILSYSQSFGGRVILIFDEIHDAVDVFEQNLIHRLWSFVTSKALFKTYILSATFSVAAKTVIKYIAETTNRQIHIIETQRNQYSQSKLSNLHIHITEEKSYGQLNKPEFTELLEIIISKHNYVNILSSSVSLAKAITDNNSEIRQLFNKYSKPVNLCIGDNNYIGLDRANYGSIKFSPKYQSDCCNVGTMFKTGISIEHENSALVVILPNRYSMDKGFISQSSLGIFSNGITDVIQALARVRKKSDIYVIAPTPNMLIIPPVIDYNSINYNYLSLMPNVEILQEAHARAKKQLELRNENDSYTHPYDELYFHIQKSLIEDMYNHLKDNRGAEISAIQELDREGLPRLEFPTLDEYIMQDGEHLLKSYYAIFGKDLSAYMLWAAFNNQFVNCRLKSISYAKQVESSLNPDDTIQDIIYNSFMQYIEEFEKCDYLMYQNIYGILLAKKETLKPKIAIRDSNNILHRHIMTFIQKSLKGNQRLNKKYHTEVEEHIQDKPFKAEDYLLCCIANANLYAREELIGEVEVYRQLIDTYKILGEIRKLFINDNNLVMIDPNTNKEYIYREYTRYGNFFSEEIINDIIGRVRVIAEKDVFFGYLESLQNIDYDNTGKTFTSIYNLLRSTFFEVTKGNQKEPTKIAREKGYTTKNRPNIDYVEIIELPEKRTGINLLYKYEYMKEENYEKKVLDDMLIDEHNIPNFSNELEELPMTTIERDEDGNLVAIPPKKEK